MPQAGVAIDPVQALAMGQAVPAPAPPAPPRHTLPQWAIDQGVQDPWFGGPGHEGAAAVLAAGGTLNFGDEIGGAIAATQHNAIPFLTGQPTHWQQDYEAVRDAYRDAEKTYTAAHPLKAVGGQVLGSIPTMEIGGLASAIRKVGADALTEAPTLAKNLTTAAGKGATYGGVAGAGAGEGDLENRVSSATKGAGTGAVFGAAAVPLGYAATRGATAIGEMLTRDAPKPSKATSLLADALTRDKISPADATAALRNDPTGQLALVDLGGDNSYTQRLGRALVSLKTPASGDITKFLDERAQGQYGRFGNAIRSNLTPDTDTYGNLSTLIRQRATESQPLYERAYQGGSIAPFEDQLRDQLQAATSAKGLIARQMRQIEKENSGALAARGAAGADTRARYMDLNSQLEQAEQNRQAVQEMFQRAKQDKTSQAPGAVWSPRIQQFLDDPIMRQGINEGLEVQRLEALAENRPFNPSEYAITGTDENGKAIVGAVPNMRLLNAGKIGLDKILEQYRDPTTLRLNLDQRGRAIDNVRRAFIAELDNLNPDYRAARAAWAGPSAAMDSVEAGQRFLNMDPEEIGTFLSGRNEPQQQFFRIGAGRALAERISKASDNADLTKRVFGNPQIRSQIEAAFGKENSDAFAKAMASERNMADTKDFLLGNSSTVNKALDFLPASPLKQALIDAGHGAMGGLIGGHGSLTGAVTGALAYPAINIGKSALEKIAERTVLSNPQNAAELGRLLTTPGRAGAAQFENEMSTAIRGRGKITDRQKTIGKLLSKTAPYAGVIGAGISSVPQGQ